MQFLEHDAEVLLLCEDLQETLKKFKTKMSWSDDEDLSLQKRLALIDKAIDSERRLIEEISLPGRYIVEHFTAILNETSYSMGFQYRELKGSRGPLTDISIGEWGTITVKVGNIEMSWRDQDVQYMFYPDQVVVRPKDSAEDEIAFFFSYSFKYAPGRLKKFQAVKDDPQTAYWHESLTI